MLYKRIVAKLGTNLLTGGSGCLNFDIMSNLVSQIAQLHQTGHELVIVSSGAVAAGRKKLPHARERKDIPFKQMLASVGQSQLMNIYEHLMNRYDITIAQALLTRSDLSHRAGYLNTRNTLLALIELGVICIVNENDVVATEEIGGARFGDNDNLSAMVANLIDADLLILLTDIDGLYSADPHHNPNARIIPKVEKFDSRIQRLASKNAGILGVGGMATKIEAAKMATSCGMAVVISSGYKSDALIQIAQGENLGTLFTPSTHKLESKKRWMLSGLSSKGKLSIDDGAVTALKKQNKSLLPAGITSLEGKFRRGDVVDILGNKGNLIGRGISNYTSKDINIIKGTHSKQVSEILGYEYGSEIVHRNNMVLI